MLKAKIIAALFTLILVMMPAIALAQPSVAGYYGSARLNGFPVSGSTIVRAFIAGVQVGETTTAGDKYGYVPTVFHITGNHAGKTVNFTLTAQNLPAGSILFESGGNTLLNLAAVSVPLAPAAITLTPSNGSGLFMITGSNFTANSPLTVNWDSAVLSIVPSDATVASDGSFAIIATVPTGATGSKLVTVSDQATSLRRANATFVVGSSSGLDNVVATTLDSGAQATADYDAATDTLTIGIPQGSSGEAGEGGITTVVATTRPANENATTTFDKATGILTLGIPRGAAGPQGEAGTTGAAGLAGAAGGKGDTGLPGTAGATGDTGDTGPQGTTGKAGATGVKGDTGPEGVKGGTGETGKGAPGGPILPIAAIAVAVIALIVAIVSRPNVP